MKTTWQKVLAAAVLVLFTLTCWWLQFDRQSLKEADAACQIETKKNCSRLDKLETDYRITISNIAEDVKEIKSLIKEKR